MVPCGTPLIISNGSESFLFTETNCFLPMRKCPIHFPISPPIPNFLSFGEVFGEE